MIIARPTEEQMPGERKGRAEWRGAIYALKKYCRPAGDLIQLTKVLHNQLMSSVPVPNQLRGCLATVQSTYELDVNMRSQTPAKSSA